MTTPSRSMSTAWWPALLALVLAGTLLAGLPSPARADTHISVATWRTTEISLTASQQYADPLTDVTVDAVFSGPGGRSIRRPAFWDGGTTWRVRFAPTVAGTWVMTTTASNPSDAGLHGVSRVIDAVPYAGDLEIYRRGFVGVSDNGRYLQYRDGTPFFYLGDTHWVLPHERFHTSNAPGVDSQFRYVIDKRVQQGFTVLQSEPIWQPHVTGDVPRADEAPVADLRDGFSAADLPGFRNLDEKYEYAADQGLVHANGLVTWAQDPAFHPDTFTPAYMYAMARYWVARYGSYPVIWTIAQEIDDDMYGLYTPSTMQSWYAVGEAISDNDDYGHVVMPHMENQFETLASTSSWRDKPYHDAFGAQWQSYDDWDFNQARDFWFHVPTRPSILYEAPYEDFWTDSRRALSAGYKAMQLGMYGYGYGVAGVWNDVYSRPGEPADYGTDYQLPEKYQWWFTGANRSTGDQLRHFRDFYESLEWWRLEPRFDDPAWSQLAPRSFPSSDGNRTYVVLFADTTTTTGQLRGMDDAVEYRALWHNPRTGGRIDVPGAVRSSGGAWAIPAKPTTQDWVLLVTTDAVPSPSPFSASSTWDSTQTPDKAFDGDPGTNWQACAGCWAGHWLAVDFGQSRTFDSVTVMEYDDRTRAYRVEYWDGGAWRTAYTGSGGFGDRVATTVTFPAVTGTKARLYYLDGVSSAPIVYEMTVGP